MGLNESKGNMYDFVTHTWNTVKGECFHNCSYCYMKRWGKLKPVRFDEKELKTNLGTENFIFVGSSCDMWAHYIPDNWKLDTLKKCLNYWDNRYLFQTKNPANFKPFLTYMYDNTILTTTIETDKFFEHMGRSPHPSERATHLADIVGFDKMVTIEPIMEFDLVELVFLIEIIKPIQVNIGADSGNNNLPEPNGYQVKELIKALESFTTVKQKPNLKRLVGEI